MAISKNNPAVRDNQKLVVYCPTCNKIMKMLMRVPGRQMVYVCSDDVCGYSEPITKGSYKNLKHEWTGKK